MAGGAHSPLELRSGSLASGVGGFHGSEDTTSDFDDTGSDTSFFAAGAATQPHGRAVRCGPTGVWHACPDRWLLRKHRDQLRCNTHFALGKQV